MNRITISREQFVQLVATLAVCQASGFSNEVNALVFTAAAKGIIGKETVEGILESGGKVEEMIVIGSARQVSVKQVGGGVVVMEIAL